MNKEQILGMIESTNSNGFNEAKDIIVLVLDKCLALNNEGLSRDDILKFFELKFSQSKDIDEKILKAILKAVKTITNLINPNFFIINCGKNVFFKINLKTDEVLVDLNDLYLDIYKSIVSGTYCLKYVKREDIEKGVSNKQELKIDGKDKIENLISFWKSQDIHGYECFFEN